MNNNSQSAALFHSKNNNKEITVNNSKNVPVSKPLVRHAIDDIEAIVVTKGSRQFLVSHARSVFMNAPQASQFTGIHDAEDALSPILPLGHISVLLTVQHSV
jgi:hypothetical protein